MKGGDTMVQIIGDTTVLHELLCKNKRQNDTSIHFESGAMACYNQAALLGCLQDMAGVTAQHFKAAIGCSGGASVMLGWAAGRLPEVFELFEHMGNRFFSRERVSELPYDPIQLKYLRECTRQHISKKEIQELSIPPFVNVTEAETGGSVFVDVREAQDPYALIQASQSLPVLSSAVQLEQGKCVDGSCGIDFSSIIKQLRPRKLLIVGSRPVATTALGKVTTWRELMPVLPALLEYKTFPALVHTAMWALRYSPMLRHATANMTLARDHMLARIPALRQIKVCFVCPDVREAISPFEWNPSIMRSQSALFTKNLRNACLDIIAEGVHHGA